MAQEIETISIIECPECGFKVRERMDEKEKTRAYECKRCGVFIVAQEEECCIFCKYGTVACPEAQHGKA